LSDLELAASQQRARSCFALRSSIQFSDRPVSAHQGFAKASPEAGRVGQERFELSTPRLSSVCSNQLSYWPVGLIGLSRPNSKPCHLTRRSHVDRCGIDRNRLDRSQRQDSRKEVIQPQVPLRLPCYDFTPVTSHSLGGCLRSWRTDF
jgi:hypothetical protein